jgi:hypothetical protein
MRRGIALKIQASRRLRLVQDYRARLRLSCRSGFMAASDSTRRALAAMRVASPMR